MPPPLIEMPVAPRLTVLTAAIRRDILSAVRTAAAIVFQVGADLLDDVATRPSAVRALPKGSVLERRRALFRRTRKEA